MTNTLIIFTKNLILGKVKTRIARVIGAEKALFLYQMLLDQIKSTMGHLPGNINCKIYYSEFIDKTDKWPLQVEVHLQEGTGLGQRMAKAINSELVRANHKVCLIGTDIEALTTDIITNAFELLDANDVVLGPAFDGGYYLIGMKKLNPVIFKGVKWGSESVLESTLDLIASEGLTHELLPVLRDVDQVNDIPENLLGRITSRFKN